jgi:predicted MFS family arabinose efflux permease
MEDSTMTTDVQAVSADTQALPPLPDAERMPWSGLIALFFAGFLTIINETMPAGLLPRIAGSLHLSQAVTGQTVTIYALATAATAIPLSALLGRWGRRTVLASALAAFVVANLAIAFTDNFAAIMAARFVAGVGAGLIWSNLAVYAARLAPPARQGRAMAVANAGTPIALTLGLPLGTLLGDAAGWHATFAVVAIAGALLIAWAFLSLPNLPGQPAAERTRMTSMLRTRGLVTILAVMSGFFLAHNILYTYVSTLATWAGIGSQIEWVLLTFGVAAFASIAITGIWIDRRHRHLTVTSMVLVGAGALALGFALVSPVLIYIAAVVWGLGFGGGATLFITAGIRVTGDAIVAPMVTLVNLAIAAGGVVGGLLLAGLGTVSIPWAAVIIMAPTAAAAIIARRHAFPHWTAAAPGEDA